MSPTRVLTVLAVVLALGTLVPGTAHALSCDDGPYEWESSSLLPADGETDVPPDTWIWIRLDGYGHPDDSRGTATVALFDAADAEIEVAEQGAIRVPTGRFVAFAPSAPLGPDAEYRVELDVDDEWDEWGDDDDDSAGGADTVSYTFTTGAQDSGGAGPDVPAVERLRLEAGPNELSGGFGCPWYSAGPDTAAFELTSDGRVNVIARVDDADDAGPADPLGLLAAAGEDGELTVRDHLRPTTTVYFRVGAYDLAGNFSGWSEPIAAKMPAAGCSSEADLAEASLALALLLAGAGLLRRRLRLLASSEWAPLLVAGLVAAAGFAPATGYADAPPVIDGSAEVSVPAPAPAGWQSSLDAHLKRDQMVWGALGVASGGVQIGFGAALPSRAPGALSGTIANAAAWMPSVVGLVTVSALRGQVRNASSPADFRSSLKVGFAVTAISCGIAWGVGTPAAILSGFFLDGSFGVGVAILGVPLALLAANLTFGVNLARLNRVAPEKKRARATGRPAPQLLAVGPTGLLLAF